jgi:DNA topoisomerase-1
VRSKKRGSRSFYGCANYPTCDFKVWQKPVIEPCPLCSYPFLVLAGGAKNPKLVCGRGNKECGYSRGVDEPGPGEAGAENGEAAAASDEGASRPKADEKEGAKRPRARPASVAP